MGRLRQTFLYFWNFRYLPMKYRWPLIKLRRRVLPTETGLGLRAALRHARSLKHPPEPSPCIFVLRLLWPFPSWHLPAVLPRPPRAIMADPRSVTCRGRDIMYLRSMPLWCARDTPLRSFYRLYEAFCAADGHMVMYETEYFWDHPSPEWATVNLPDPRCSDREQYAIMASLAEMLVEAFRWRLGIGLRRNGDIEGVDGPPPKELEYRPSWTAKVPPLKEKLIIHPDHEQYFESPFHDRKIITTAGYFFTV